MRFITVGIVALALIPAIGSAQSARHSPAAAFAVVPAADNLVQAKKGPTIEAAAVGVKLAPVKLDAAARARARRSGIGYPGALMVVGGGAMVAGNIIGGEPGTFFLVGGALIALYGLYLLVQ
jgi:hypothetical protein